MGNPFDPGNGGRIRDRIRNRARDWPGERLFAPLPVWATEIQEIRLPFSAPHFKSFSSGEFRRALA
jgi:hypothetical protein